MTEHDPSKSSQSAGDAEEQTVHHRSPRQKRDVEAARMQLNLTSMIDVIFQLLIYFVVTASFTANEGVIATELPYGGQSANPMDLPSMKLNIDLRSTGASSVQIRVNDREAPGFSALTQRLIDLQHNPDRGRSGSFAVDDPVKIRPQGQVRWEHVVNAFNAALRARYTNVAITAPSSG